LQPYGGAHDLPCAGLDCVTDSVASQMPFANVLERDIHFKKYGHEFGATDELQYEEMADNFMVAPLTLTMRECTRPNGTDRVRLNIANKHFGVGVVASPIVRTFYGVRSLFTGLSEPGDRGVLHQRMCEDRSMRYRCPVCMFASMPYPPTDYHICPCCSTEFGNDDVDFSHHQLREMWIGNGAHWFFGEPPTRWNPWTQLIDAGLGGYVPQPFDLRFQVDAIIAPVTTKNFRQGLQAEFVAA
jgi:hypothetical protein